MRRRDIMSTYCTEFGIVQKLAVIYERINASGDTPEIRSGDKQDYILNLEYSRVA